MTEQEQKIRTYEDYKNQKNQGKPVKEEADSLTDLLKTAFWAAMLAIIIRTFAFEPFNIPSGSMIPTLLVGDYLFVSKYSYGYSRYSFPLGIIQFDGRLWEKTPERGDVAVFRQPTNTQIDYIKRIVGLPGDRIQVIDGVLHINDAPALREIVDFQEMSDAFGVFKSYKVYKERLPNNRSHMIMELSDDEPLDNTEIFEVPEGYYFAMGDNRDNSQDSRVTAKVGLVPAENLIGRAEFIFFSTDGSANLHEIWKWPSAIRFDRLFEKIR